MAVSVLALGGTCFTLYATLIAGFATRTEVAGNVFIFTVMPMVFLGGLFPDQLLPH